jgi:predicted O-methyltransferase YrrM
MTPSLEVILSELERFAEANDRGAAVRADRMLNITRDTGEFLAVLVRATRARHVLEIGTSNGYSTLWLANAVCATGGIVTTVESSDTKVKMANENFSRSGLAAHIKVIHDDAGRVLAATPDASCDLVFLDAERKEYPGWWPRVKRVVRPGGLLVVDNATSHADEMAPFLALVKDDGAFATCLVPVGKGEFLAVRASQ